MKKYYFNLILAVLTFSFSNCGNHNAKAISSNIDNKNSGIEMNQVSDIELKFVVSVAEGYNYDSLKSVAVKASGILKFEIDSLGRYYNPKKGSIVKPEDDKDELYAGQYFLRRGGDNFISIEMRYAYLDTLLENNFQEADKFRADTTKLFVCAAMFTNKNKADSLLKIIKKDWPASKIISTEIYMGCMH